MRNPNGLTKKERGNKMKTWEVIKALSENSKLKFKNTTSKNTMEIHQGDYVVVNTNGKHIGLNDFSEWVLVQEPVTFIEAVNSDKRFKAEIWTKYYKILDVLDVLNGYDGQDAKAIICGK